MNILCYSTNYVQMLCIFSQPVLTTDYAILYKWYTVASGTFKYVVPRLTCHHKGAARVMTFQPRGNIF